MANDTLYHYCSNEAFVSIIQCKSIRLSSLLLSNDSTEGRLVAQLLADQIRKDERNKWKAEYVEELLEAICAHVGGYGFCLSTKTNSLGQWRAYARDGQGISIGFYAEQLKTITAVELLKVEYDPSKQEEIAHSLYLELKKEGPAIEYDGGLVPAESCLDGWNPIHKDTINSLGQKNASDFEQSLLRFKLHGLLLKADIFRLKHNGFHEESEWRLLAKVSDEKNSPKFAGQANKCNRYIERQIDPAKKPIIEVVLGPKNQTPEYVIKNLLEAGGFEGVRVSKSNIPYR